MKKLAAMATAAVLAATSLVPVSANAASVNFNVSFGQQDQFVYNQCSAHPSWRGCDDWRRNHGHWSRNDYRNWYLWNHGSLGNAGAGLFAFAIGAGILGAIANSANKSNNDSMSDYDAHVLACHRAYRSYQETGPHADMYNTGSRWVTCKL